ncbi:MAG: endonuclease MutS2 [Nitrospira sp.]|nr:endonuclease MutS2 [Nitrospira sp.]MDH4244084.1 endonuclease MutS2 [Nitrospira sp.]MDH4356459.1 endonuclease MutS2 [Nitrospira sp.]MDH5319883.1 endonuclease MutS2 [Nitrospira sp.]
MHQMVFEQAAQAVEWPRFLDFLSQQAQSVIGGARCRTLSLSNELASVSLRQQETTEMVSLLEGSDPVPTLSFPDIREQLTRSKKGGVLEAGELRDCAIVLSLMAEIERYAVSHRDQIQALVRTVEPLQGGKSLQGILKAIEGAIQSDGSMKDTASPELRRLTHHALELKHEMRQKLEQILHSRRYEEVLQESYFAQREGRYVVPVKADMRGRIPGIVHDISASGATVFLEPRELVELNNSIKVADLEVEREVQRILRELTSLVAGKAEAISQGIEVLAEWDVIRVKAEVSRRLKCNPVVLNETGRIMLKQARHPLLLIAKDHVLANDILMDESVRVLVISGPNTGGKTVTLKIIGLFALMVRAGLHLPCAPESEMAIFTDLHADIGDAQDLTRDLSSFSAHMMQMIQLLSEGATGLTSSEPSIQRSLVLLDEPVTSTDPQEGAALAEALLCRLAELNMKVVATTHYGALKELAQTTPGFANASVEFDVERLAPTYRLFMGIPGGSSALEIAGRLGMDQNLLNDAKKRLRREDQRLDELMADLQRKQHQLIEDSEKAHQARREAEEAAREAQALRAQLEEAQQEARRGLKKKLGEQFQRARAEVQATVDSLKREQKLIKAKETKQRLHELEMQVRQDLTPSGQTIPFEQLGIGDAVEIVGLGTTGNLLEAPQGKKRVRVKVGEGEILATVSNLVGIARESRAESAQPALSPSGLRRVSANNGLGLDEQTVVDVRGQAADEALEQVLAALDRATLSGAPYLRIIHGHGSGRLKSVVREYLKNSPYVAEFRAGDRAEGGDGVTVARIR